jgi:putative pyruvate formate lyase activating enzyme
MELKEVLRQIVTILQTGINHVGFVSPSHFVPHVKVIVDALRELGLSPVFVYNTNGYDRPEIIHEMAQFIDVYLPDFKYSDADLGRKYSGISGYPEIALAAIKEMMKQKGTELPLNDHGYARKGIVIRHLILPGNIENSLSVLRTIARELSADIHISLMSQYFPNPLVMSDEFLSRTLNRREYERIVDELEDLGFSNGWVQDLVSQQNYRPDFERGHPFEG